jgi:NADH:ubiquinone oxidoreductase subunit
MMATLGTLLFTWAKGKLVGTDTAGNRYYTERSVAKGRRTKRWVLFNGKPEASLVPPEWHAWLHYTSDSPLTGVTPQSWQKPHQSNKTGSPGAYLPPGHDLAGGVRERATGDYEAWRP